MKRLFWLLLLAACPTWAATRYVDSTAGACTANYSIANRNCTGSDGNSYATVALGLAATAGGDTLLIREGTYTGNQVTNPPAGTSWSDFTRIARYGSEVVTLRPPAGQTNVIRFDLANRKWIEIDGLVLDGLNVSADVIRIQTSSYIRIKNCDIKNEHAQYATLGHQGIMITNSTAAPNSDYNEIINNKIHITCGEPNGHDHGVYLESSNNLFDGNEFYDNVGYGLNVYNGYTGRAPSNNIIRNNILHHNNRGVVNKGEFQLSTGAGGVPLGNQIYNNVIYDDGYSAIRVGGGGSPNGTLIYNNTIYAGASLGGIYLASDAINTVVRNNIVRKSTGAGTITNLGSGTTLSNNTTTQDPLFVNAGAADFHLGNTSPCLGTGFDLSALFTTDIEARTRANGTTTGNFWDIGAYELEISPPGTIVVLTPNGGESVQIGATFSITWRQISVSGNVRIRLTRNDGASWEDIDASTANDGLYDWIPAGASSAGCRVEISDSDTGAIVDQSDNVFTIVSSGGGGTITLVLPATGDLYRRGQSFPTRWTTNGAVSGNVKIELSRNNGGTYEILSSSFPFNGADFSWTATKPSSSVCRIKVTSLNDTSVFGTSGAFRLGGGYFK